MKHSLALVMLGTLAIAGSAAASAGSISLNQFNHGFLPVLVRVNAHGKVTQISPSVRLAPRYARLLQKNIEELVTGPAMEHNRPTSSQFIMNVAMKTSPRSDGSYDAQFTYVSATPAPSGPQHWVSIDGHRLALGPDSYRPHIGPRYWPVDPYSTTPIPGSRRMPTPAPVTRSFSPTRTASTSNPQRGR